MMITIAHLYYDLLNLYGESGNIKALKKCLEDVGIDVKIKLVTMNDNLEIEKYDMIYLGMGTEDNQLLALNHLKNYSKDIKKAINNDTIVLATGNSMELFGKNIISGNIKNEGLGIFNYSSKLETFRIVDESLAKCDFIDSYVLGFQNHSGVIKNIDKPLFKMIKGTGSFPNSTTEGYHYKNFFGTYLIGPILVRNPALLKFFCVLLLENKDSKIKKPFSLELEENAHKTFIENYYSDVL